RIGTGPMSYDKTREPLCALLASPGPAPIKYYQPMQSNVDVPSAAGAWCGCSTSLVLTDKGITRVTLKNGGVTQFPIAGQPGGILPAGQVPRAMAVTWHAGVLGLVANFGEGTVSVFDL